MYSYVDKVWKIGDFGTVSDGTSEPHTTGNVRGTGGYRAPEMLGPEPKYYNRSDIWAFGCILAEIGTGQKPFEDDWTIKYHYDSATEAPVSSFAYWDMDNISKLCSSEFCSAMLERAPWKRPTAKDLLQGIETVLNSYGDSLSKPEGLLLSLSMLARQSRHVLKWLPHWYKKIPINPLTLMISEECDGPNMDECAQDHPKDIVWRFIGVNLEPEMNLDVQVQQDVDMDEVQVHSYHAALVTDSPRSRSLSSTRSLN
jgi:serine/threonine protein kinase